MKTRQDWTVGNKVKVGFLVLTVIQHNVLIEGEVCVRLINSKGQTYLFSPYNGLSKEQE